MKSRKSASHKRRKRVVPTSTSDSRFIVRRTVNWGDCDPAGFIYTPRVLDFACEIVDAWFREHLKFSWWQLKTRGRGLGFPTVNSVCDFMSIVRPDQALQLKLSVLEIGKSSVVFEIDGMTEGNRRAFRVKLVSCAIEMITYRATPIPLQIRKRLEAYKAACC